MASRLAIAAFKAMPKMVAIPKRGYAVKATVPDQAAINRIRSGMCRYDLSSYAREALQDGNTRQLKAAANLAFPSASNPNLLQDIAYIALAQLSVPTQTVYDKACEVQAGFDQQVDNLITRYILGGDETNSTQLVSSSNVDAVANSVVTLGSILGDVAGLPLDLKLKASINEWIASYESTKVLVDHKMFWGTLTGATLSESTEVALLERLKAEIQASLEHHYESVLLAAAAGVEQEAHFPDPDVSPRYVSSAHTLKEADSVNNILKYAAGIPANKYTIEEIVHQLAVARNKLQVLAVGLAQPIASASAETRSREYFGVLANIRQAISAGSLDTAAQLSKPLASPRTNLSIAEAGLLYLNKETSAVASAGVQLKNIVESLPQDLLQGELAKRKALFGNNGVLHEIDSVLFYPKTPAAASLSL